VNKAEAKREARSLVGTMILASPGEFIDGASAEYDSDEDRERVFNALIALANQLLGKIQ
jgi:hypothetical protein